MCVASIHHDGCETVFDQVLMSLASNWFIENFMPNIFQIIPEDVPEENPSERG